MVPRACSLAHRHAVDDDDDDDDDIYIYIYIYTALPIIRNIP